MRTVSGFLRKSKVFSDFVPPLAVVEGGVALRLEKFRKVEMSGSPKQTRFYLLVLLVMGSCIGSGIFINPTGVAKAIPHAGMLLPVWILGGLITLSGALSYGELAARFPQAGGVYVYLKEAYGSLAAFLFGWVVLMAVTSGAIAGLGLVF